MSDRGSPADHTDPTPSTPADDAPASASAPDAGDQGGTDANSPDDPSPSEGAKQAEAPKPTLLDVIKSAVDKPDPQGASPDPAKTEKHDDQTDPADPKKAVSDLDDKRFDKHPRWQEIKGQNQELRQQVESLTPDADQFRKINAFMTEYHLSPDEVGEGFIIMAMAKNGDPRVLQKLDEFRNRVALNIGEALPADIQAKVDEGEISEAAAKELAKARAAATNTERALAQRDADDRNARQAREAEAVRRQQQQAVGDWETQMRKRDPDFAMKENAIAAYAKALIQDYGPPKDTKDVVALVEAAYARVTKDFKAAIPQRGAVKRAPVASSATGAKPVPKSLLDVVKQAAQAS